MHYHQQILWMLAVAVFRPGSKISGRKGQDKLASLPQTPEPRCGTLRAGPKTNPKSSSHPACDRSSFFLRYVRIGVVNNNKNEDRVNGDGKRRAPSRRLLEVM